MRDAWFAAMPQEGKQDMATKLRNMVDEGCGQTPAPGTVMANTLPLMQQTSAGRMRRHRERRRKGLRSIGILIKDEEIEALIRRGLLEPEGCDDPIAIRSALHRLLDQSLARNG